VERILAERPSRIGLEPAEPLSATSFNPMEKEKLSSLISEKLVARGLDCFKQSIEILAEE